jgi:hypothetical protein
MPTLNHQGASLHYEIHGTAGPPLLLIQGVGVAGRCWKPQVDGRANERRQQARPASGIPGAHLSETVSGHGRLRGPGRDAPERYRAKAFRVASFTRFWCIWTLGNAPQFATLLDRDRRQKYDQGPARGRPA